MCHFCGSVAVCFSIQQVSVFRRKTSRSPRRRKALKVTYRRFIGNRCRARRHKEPRSLSVLKLKITLLDILFHFPGDFYP
jgi:hypothetical protein